MLRVYMTYTKKVKKFKIKILMKNFYLYQRYSYNSVSVLGQVLRLSLIILYK